MRHVFSSMSECMHIYANQRIEDDYGESGHISFQGPVAYSYGHYPIGRIVSTKTEKRILVQENTYSHSTAKHISFMCRATSHYEKIYVIDPGKYRIDNEMHVKNIMYMHKQYTEYMAKAKRALVRNIYGSALRELLLAKTYCQWFKCTGKLPKELKKWLKTSESELTLLHEEKQIEIGNRKIRIDSEEHKEKVRLANEKRYAKELADLREKMAIIDSGMESRITAWRNHETIECNTLSLRNYPTAVLRAAGLMTGYGRHKPYSYGYDFSGEKTYLRLSKDRTRIETSRHAQVLVESAIKLWPFIYKSYIEQTCEEYKHIMINNYPLSKIDKGNITIGCHHIDYDELFLIAEQLHLI